MKRFILVCLACTLASFFSALFAVELSQPALAARLEPATCLGGQSDPILDSTFPGRMERIEAARSAEPGLFLIFDSDGSVLARYDSEEAFLLEVWSNARATKDELTELTNGLDATFKTKPLDWTHVHEAVDNQDFDGDGDCKHHNHAPIADQ